MPHVWFNGWDDIARVVVSGIVTFAALLTSIRIAGNRSLSSMNASDFIVTVAIGTTFATTMLSSQVSIASGVAAIATLLTIQYLTVWLSVKYPRLRQRAEGEPVILLRDGKPLTRVLERAHVSLEELRQAVREHGYGGFADLEFIVLEANGRFSVVPKEDAADRTADPSSESNSNPYAAS